MNIKNRVSDSFVFTSWSRIFVFFEDYKNYFRFFIFFLFFLISLVMISFLVYSSFLNQESVFCGDGTLSGKCSINRKPFFCEDGVLIEKATSCGCPLNFTIIGESCWSGYEEDQKEMVFDYYLNGEKSYIEFVMYKSFVDNYLNSSNRTYVRNSRESFELERINEKFSRELLLPLVIKIFNLDSDRENQARIAVSLVQNLDYGFSDEKLKLSENSEVVYSRYPYESLLDYEGVCEEKSRILSFLLKEIGFENALLYFPELNHQAVGIKCPVEHSIDESGFCFIETTGVSIISNNKEYYDFGERLSLGFGGVQIDSNPEFFYVTGGISFSDFEREYKDAFKLNQINEKRRNGKKLTFIEYYELEKIRERYGFNY